MVHAVLTFPWKWPVVNQLDIVPNLDLIRMTGPRLTPFPVYLIFFFSFWRCDHFNDFD